jgi:hypothetical protein
MEQGKPTTDDHGAPATGYVGFKNPFALYQHIRYRYRRSDLIILHSTMNKMNKNEDSSIASDTTSMSALTGTREELFRIWLASCFQQEKGLRDKASRFFRSLVSKTEIITSTGITLKTKASHGEALALLIQSLGPAFESDQLPVRTQALSCIRGALEGCQGGDLKLMQLLGSFYLVHCGPVEHDDVDEDYDEQLRDEAIQGLTALMRWKSEGSLEARLGFAQQGVERRCAVPEGSSSTGFLSSLPRSRRSLCFQLLRVTVDAVAANIPASSSPSDDSQLIQFASFAARCLHGESDPRCLMQLLQLLHAMQKAWLPLVPNTFPIMAVFEAVAPYYPIQFTPPPNDAHGITRKGLRMALLAALSFTGFDKDESETSMLSLSLGLVLEGLLPPPEDGPPVLKEQRECLEDLESLLLDSSDRIASLSVVQLRQIADTLYTVHEQTSMAAIAASGTEQDLARDTANQCRDVVAKIALESERNQTVWDTFVNAVLETVSSKLSSPSQGRIAIAYAACLCSSGGPKTLRRSLELGLGALLEQLDDNFLDENDLATAAYGVGAFFSSTRAALEKCHKDGVVVHPHPLQGYSGIAVDKIMRLLDDQEEGSEIAAIRAMESILVVSPANHFLPGQLAEISRFLKSTTEAVLSPDNEHSNRQRASMQSLGVLLGQALNTESDERALPTASTVLQDGTMKVYLMEDVLFDLVSSVGKEGRSDRCDRKVLALASICSLSSATRAIQPLVKATHDALLKQDFSSGKLFAEALAVVFLEEGSYAPRAFQQLGAPSVTALELISTLVSQVSKNYSSMDIESVSPANAILEKAFSIAPLLQTAYIKVTIAEHVDALVVAVSKSMPPLTEPDVIKCSVEISFLSAALQCHETKIRKESRDKLVSMKNDFANFALGSEYHAIARSCAAQCLHSVVARYLPKGEGCMVREIMTETVMIKLRRVVQSLQKCDPHNDEKKMVLESKLEDCFGVIGLLGSAAAQRGGQSAATADQLIQFLVELACIRVSMDPFSRGDDSQLDLTVFDGAASSGLASSISVQAASAVGAILSSESGSRLWKQRITHIASKRIQKILDEKTELSTGILATVAHVLCCSDLRSVSSVQLELFARVVVRGLAPQFTSTSGRYAPTMMKLTLASLVKLLSVAPSVMKGLAYHVVTGSMRAYAAADGFDSGSGLACKLLALQTLQAATRIVGASQVLKESKAPVVSILGAAMQSKSLLLRQAAVEVRNTWLLVE